MSFALLGMLAALSQEPSASLEPTHDVTVVEDVVVEGRARATLQDFVGGLSVVENPDGQLARFDWRVCPGVLNMRPDVAQAVNDRIARVALLLRLDVGGPGCRPNIVVIASRDVDAVVRVLLQSNPRVFEFHAGTVRGAGERLEYFRDTPRTVRWWHVTREVSNGISSYTNLGALTQIAGAVVIVDLDRLPEVSVAALGDYIAMVALAQLDPRHDVSGADTILNLFGETPTGVAAPAALTQFDLDYLDALYTAARDPYRASRQESTVIWRMMTDRAPQVD